MRKALKRRCREESGAVLVLVAIMIPVFLGLAALSVDLGYFYQQQRKVQSTADSAALAGAQALSTSTAAATSQAKAYVIANMPNVPQVYTCSTTEPTQPAQPGVCITNPTTTQVKVAVWETAASFFGNSFGITSANVAASATAAATAGSTSCATPGNTCLAMFAMDSSCTPGTGITFGGGGNTLTGGVQSNGALNVGNGNSKFLGITVYGNGIIAGTSNPCAVLPSGYAGQSNTFASGPTAQAPICSTCWPINYAADFPACTGAACTGPGGTPSFCTQSSTLASWLLVSYNPGTLTSNNIYCGVGTGTASTPTTWNGAIIANQTGKTPIESTYVAGSVTLGGGSSLEACGYASSGYAASGCSAAVPNPTTSNYPLIYAVGTTPNPIVNGGSGAALVGDIFAPHGTIAFAGGGNTVSFAEAQSVNYAGGGDTGDGPLTSGTGSASSGSIALIQ
jgi:Flp pilus assembly protein TadG